MKKIIGIAFLFFCINNLFAQGSFYFWPCQGSGSNTGNTCATPNYTSVADVTAGPGLTGINPGCYSVNIASNINGGVFTNQNGSTLSPFSPIYTNIPTTYGHRISVNFTTSDPTISNATVSYSFTEGG